MTIRPKPPILLTPTPEFDKKKASLSDSARLSLELAVEAICADPLRERYQRDVEGVLWDRGDLPWVVVFRMDDSHNGELLMFFDAFDTDEL